MDEDAVLEVIRLAPESYLSEKGQLKVIYDAFSKWKRHVEFNPAALVASEEAREKSAQQSTQAGEAWHCANCGDTEIPSTVGKCGICGAPRQ